MQAYPTVRSEGNFSWPNHSRIAVVLTSEYEPEYEIKPLAGGQPNYRQMAEMRYEATRGIWRILKVLARHGVCSTFFVNGATAQKYPESVRAIPPQGHEVPRSTLTDDYAMMGTLAARPFGSHRDMLAVWMDEFDVLYREAETEPRL